jgi:hypothetical protein
VRKRPDQLAPRPTCAQTNLRPDWVLAIAVNLVGRKDLKSKLYRPHPVRTRQVPRSQTSLLRPDHGSWLGTAAGCELEARRGWCDLKTFHCGWAEVPRPAASAAASGQLVERRLNRVSRPCKSTDLVRFAKMCRISGQPRWCCTRSAVAVRPIAGATRDVADA